MRRFSTMLVAILTVWALGACAGDGAGSDGAPPAAPSNVTATAGPGYVDVAWDHDGARVSGFVIERREIVSVATVGARGPGAERVIAARLEATSPVMTLDAVEVGSVGAEARSFRDESVESGVSYRYGVRAVGAGGSTSAVGETPEEGVSPLPPDGAIGSNPDPDRFLAAIVRDGAEPVGDALVSGFLVEHGDALDPYRMTASSGDSGVALLVDRDVVDWLPEGVYDVLVSVWLPSSRTYAMVLVEDVPFPGTFDVDLADPRLASIASSVDPEVTARAWVEFGREVRDWTLYGRYLDVRDDGPVTLLIEPMEYDTLYWLDWFSDVPTHVVGSADLRDATLFTVPDEAPHTARVRVDLTAPPSAAQAVPYACLREPRERHRHMLVPCSNAFDTVSWTAELDGGALLTDEWGEWRFVWLLGEHVMGVTDVEIPYGGEMTVIVGTDAASYQAGETVQVIGSIVDAYDHHLRRAQLTDGAATEVVHAELQLRDPDGSLVVDRWIPADLAPEAAPSFALPAEAMPGTYVLQYTFPTGPYQGDIVATTTFEVGVP